MNIVDEDEPMSVESNMAYKNMQVNKFKSVTIHQHYGELENTKVNKMGDTSKEQANAIVENNCESATPEPELSVLIRKNFAKIIELLEAFPLCDYLFQDGVITMSEHSEIRQRWKISYSEANDELMKKILKREFDHEILRKGLDETKQSRVIKLLFPGK